MLLTSALKTTFSVYPLSTGFLSKELKQNIQRDGRTNKNEERYFVVSEDGEGNEYLAA